MKPRRILGALALSTALGSSLLLGSSAPTAAQVLDCRSWQSSSAGCGELFFNKTPDQEVMAPGTANANPAVARPALPNHSTGAVIGNQAQNPAQTGGNEAGGVGSSSAATSNSPGSMPSASVNIVAPSQAPNVSGPQAGPAAGALPQNPPVVSGAGAATGTGVVGNGIAGTANNVNTPQAGTELGTDIGTVGSARPNPVVTGANTTGANTTNANVTTGAAAQAAPAQVAPASGMANMATTAPVNPAQTVATENPAPGANVTGNSMACGDLGMNPTTATDSTLANGPANVGSANAATTTGTNATPETTTTASTSTGTGPTSVGRVNPGTGAEVASTLTGCDSPQVQPNVTTEDAETE